LIYSVRHTTTFRYQPAVRESVMEVRLQSRSDGAQHLHTFQLDVSPAANIMQYRDFMGNIVHHFDIAGNHTQVKVTAQFSVEVEPAPAPLAADAGSWADLDHEIDAKDYWEMLLPSQFAKSSDCLQALATQLGLRTPRHSAAVADRIEPGHLPVFRLRPKKHKSRFSHRRRPSVAPGSLPGLRSHHDCLGASAPHSLPLRQWLHVSPR
jgi:transglutaminase-like putative cysteine protease